MLENVGINETGNANTLIPGKNEIDLHAGIPKYVEIQGLMEKKPPGKLMFTGLTMNCGFMVYWSYTEKKPS
jgi:hypothetical protein